jgi:hypothetical protein
VIIGVQTTLDYTASNEELGGIWKEAIITCSTYFPDICLNGLRKNTVRLSQDIRCPGQDSNGAPPEYESVKLPLRQTAHSFLIFTEVERQIHRLNYEMLIVAELALKCSAFYGTQN